MEPISSLHNPRVKTAARLRERRGRQQQGLIVIDGLREIGRALASGVRLREAFVCFELCATDEARRLLDQLSQRDVPLLPVTAGVFEKLAFGERAEGIVAVAEPPERRLADLQLPAVALVAVLEGVEKPGNVGAVLRSADAAGVAAVIVADAGTDIYNPNCIRASLGTVFTLPVVMATTAATLAWLREQRLAIFATRVDAAQDYRQVAFGPRAALVLGSEASGLSEPWHAADVQAVKLPMLGAADSLNVSATAAVLFYEALRQRG